MRITSTQKKGFTLIEMLVSVSIFSIVMVVAMGAILTILDSNRKAQTLSSVMNNLNFALESITRTIKTGVDPEISGNVLTVDGIDLTANDFSRKKIRFKFIEENVNGVTMGSIVRCIGDTIADCDSDTEYSLITAPEVDIDEFVITSFGYDDAGDQPRTLIFLQGNVILSSEIQSQFRIQTSVSQRRLDVAGEESNL